MISKSDAPWRFSVVALLACLVAGGLADEKTKPTGGTADKPKDIQTIQAEINQLHEAHGKLKDEIARLKEENAQLRKENQALRLLLAEKTDTNAAGASTNASTTNLSQTNLLSAEAINSMTNWLTSSSGKRHNSRCRYYKTTSGRFCGRDEGQACKLCGG